jgi:hypothetical protein
MVMGLGRSLVEGLTAVGLVEQMTMVGTSWQTEETKLGEVTSTQLAAITLAMRGADPMVARREGGSGGRTKVIATSVHISMALLDVEFLSVVLEDREPGFTRLMQSVLLLLVLRWVLSQQRLREAVLAVRSIRDRAQQSLKYQRSLEPRRLGRQRCLNQRCQRYSKM